MTRAQDITTASNYRSHQSDHHTKLRETGRPLFITNRGKPEAVLLSPEAFDAMQDQLDLAESIAQINRSEQQYADGLGIDTLEGLKKIAADRGISLDR